jgi:transcriptional regulator with XRE-family HTH domain
MLNMAATTRQKKESKLKRVRETEGWSLVELSRSSGVASATLSKAEDGEPVRAYVWGRILKGINKMADKSRAYAISDIRG